MSSFDHVGHLGISLIRCHHKLNLQLNENVHEEVNHSLTQNKASLIVLSSTLDITYLVCLLCSHPILEFRIETILFSLLLRLEMEAIKDTDWLDPFELQQLEHFKRELQEI